VTRSPASVRSRWRSQSILSRQVGRGAYPELVAVSAIHPIDVSRLWLKLDE
jgi:hypothetical protein